MSFLVASAYFVVGGIIGFLAFRFMRGERRGAVQFAAFLGAIFGGKIVEYLRLMPRPEHDEALFYYFGVAAGMLLYGILAYRRGIFEEAILSKKQLFRKENQGGGNGKEETTMMRTGEKAEDEKEQ